MDLDMYLIKKTYVLQPENASKLQINLPHIQPSRVQWIIEEVGYWRKANAIHRWFVTNVQEGKDDCKEYYVFKQQLAALLAVVEEVLAAPELAPEKLPPQYYDDYYFESLRKTQQILRAVLAEDLSKADLYYSSSW